MEEDALTQTRLRELLTYDPLTGLFTANLSLGKRKAGSIAGCRTHHAGYVLVVCDGRQYPAHRLAWFYMTGRWPIYEIDHVDRVRSNNVWLNLREASASQNGYNKVKAGNNRSGFKGVCFVTRRGVYRAAIRVDRGRILIGHYETAEAANAAYEAAARRLHGAFVPCSF